MLSERDANRVAPLCALSDSLYSNRRFALLCLTSAHFFNPDLHVWSFLVWLLVTYSYHANIDSAVTKRLVTMPFALLFIASIILPFLRMDVTSYDPVFNTATLTALAGWSSISSTAQYWVRTDNFDPNAAFDKSGCFHIKCQ